MKSFTTLLLIVCMFSIAACSTTGGTTPPTNLVNTGYEIESFLEEFNTGVSTAIPPVNQFLTQTHNSGDAATVSLYATLAAQFAGAVASGLKAALPPAQVQSVASASIAPPAVITAATNVAATTPAGQ